MDKSREQLLQSLVEKLRSVMKETHKGLGLPFGEFTLGTPQVRILFSIASREEGASVKDLAEMLGVTPGAVTQFVDALVEKQLVRRDEDPNDRRILRIKLTGTAEQKFKQFRKDYFVSVSRIFNTLSDKEVVQLVELLDKVNVQSSIKECKR